MSLRSWWKEFFAGAISSAPTTSALQWDKHFGASHQQMMEQLDYGLEHDGQGLGSLGNQVLKAMDMEQMKFIPALAFRLDKEPPWNSARQVLEYEEQVLGIQWLRRSNQDA